MSEHSKIVEKIRKLLAVANNTPNEAEAQTFMARAQALLLEHGLSLKEVEQRDEFVTVEQTGKKRAVCGDEFIFCLINEFFFCRVFRIPRTTAALGSRLEIFGRPEHVAVAEYVYVFLARTFAALWSVYSKGRPKYRGKKRTYFLGLAMGIRQRLLSDRRQECGHNPQMAALIVSESAAVNAAADDRYNITKWRIRRVKGDSETFADGVVRGQQVSIRRPLPASTSIVKSIEDHR